MGAEVWNPVLELGPVQLPGVGYEFAGKVIFLGTTDATSGVNASDNQPGTVRDRPKSTLAGALAAGGGLAEAPIGNRGDVIYVLPTHTENIAAATTLSLAGMSLIGLRNRSGRRPTFTFTTSTAAALSITGAGIVVEGINFVGNVNNQVTMISVAAADCAIRGCDFTLTTSSNHSLIAISSTSAADRLVIEGNTIRGTTGAGTALYTTGIRVVGGTGIVIRNNVIYGRFGAAVGGISQLTTAVTMIHVEGNIIHNTTNGASRVANFATATCSGTLVRNWGRGGNGGGGDVGTMSNQAGAQPAFGTGSTAISIGPDNFFSNADATAPTAY